jgi:hypothetical protein
MHLDRNSIPFGRNSLNDWPPLLDSWLSFSILDTEYVLLFSFTYEVYLRRTSKAFSELAGSYAYFYIGLRKLVSSYIYASVDLLLRL